MSAECKNLWLADLQAHSVTAGCVQNKMFQCAVWLSPPALTSALWAIFKKGEANCLGVLAGVNHCTRRRLESQQSFVASGTFVFGCHHENRPTRGSGSRSCFPPRSSLLRFALNCVSAHRSVFVPSSCPSSFHTVVSSLELLLPYNVLNVEALQSLEAPVRETTTWTFFLDLFWKICCPNWTRQSFNGCSGWMQTVRGGIVHWCRLAAAVEVLPGSCGFKMIDELWNTSKVENKSKEFLPQRISLVKLLAPNEVKCGQKP